MIQKSEESSFCLPELQCQIFIIIPKAIVAVLMYMNDSYMTLQFMKCSSITCFLSSAFFLTFFLCLIFCNGNKVLV